MWSRLGRGDRAFAIWRSVRDPRFASWIAVERGRVLRELGLHGDAEREDLRGLSGAAHGAAPAAAAAAAAIGLTADAVGRSDPVAAGRRLGRARRLVAAIPPGPARERQRLRLTWVTVECAWLAGRAPSADGLPGWRGDAPWFPAGYDAGSDFHRAKGLLFAGAVTGDDRLLAAARTFAPPVLAWAVALARADLGVPGAEAEARRAWRRVAPPPGAAAAVAATPVGRRLAR